MQQLRDLVLQLRADNEQLLRGRDASHSGSGRSAPASSAPASHVPSAGVASAVTERLIVVPRDRKCPMFNGKTGMGIVDRGDTGMCAHVSAADQALFIFDHLEGEAKEEIRFHPSVEWGGPSPDFRHLERPIWLCAIICHVTAGFLL